MSKIEASNPSDSSTNELEQSSGLSKAEKVQQVAEEYVMDHHDDVRSSNDMSHLKALVPVHNSNEPILSDDETPKIIWNLDSSDKNNLSDSDPGDKTIETIEVIESGDGDDGNEVTIMLQFTTDEHSDNSPIVEAGKVTAAPQPKKAEPVKHFMTPKSVTPDTQESIAEIAKRQLETLTTGGQKRGRRPNKSSDSTAPIDKTKFNKLKSKETAVYIEIISDDTKKVQLPLHLLGRNKENPENDLLSNGRKPIPPRAGLKMPQATLSSDILTTSEVKKIVSEKFAKKSPGVTVIDNRVLNRNEKIELATITSPKHPLTSTITQFEQSKKESGIEIPQEYLYSDIKAEENYGITETAITNDTYDEDLLAILEGDHESETNNKTIEDASCSERRVYIQEVTDTPAPMSEEQTRQIAMQQFMSLPKKVNKPKTSSANTLVEILTSDWSDNEQKSGDEPLIVSSEVKSEKNELKPLPDVINKIKSPILNKSPSPKPLQIPQKSMAKKIEKPQQAVAAAPVFKRTRIIKKKIIWDPDAPETQISYASLVQGNQAKRTIIKKAVVVQTTDKANSRNSTPTPSDTPPETRKRSNSTSPSPSGSIPKKKKISELDKLLGDEGAINMLNSLERDIQNAPSGGDDDKKTRTNKTRSISINKMNEELQPQQTVTVSSPKSKQKKEIVLPKSVTLKAIPKKRTREGPGVAPKGRNSWDYVYSQRGGDDSLIIRRRSNSSYSSSASPRRLSLDVSNDVNLKQENPTPPSTNKKLPTAKNKSSQFQFVKPNAKESTPKTSPADDKLKKPAIVRPKLTASTTASKLDSKLSIENNSTLLVNYHENYIQFGLTAPQTKAKTYYLTQERMMEIVKLLKSVENDDQYNCVLISSVNGNFCDGLDLTPIIAGSDTSVEDRQKTIKEFSASLVQFLFALLHFKKPLIAGVQGACINLGVTILPLFDYVIADNTAIFMTDYAKMGQIAEGFAIACQPNKLQHSMICDLFYLCQTISGAAAIDGGLITHNIKSGVYAQHLLSECKIIASHSTQALQAMKLMKQRMDNVKKIEADLIEEQKLLMKHWASDECQKNLEEKFLTN